MPARDFLARHGWLIAIAAAYLYVFPYFASIRSANELPRVYLTQAMVDEHRFAIDTGVKTWGATADVSPSAGHQYSNKAPGSSMLAAPAYAAVAVVAGPPSLPVAMWICRVAAGVIPTLLFLWLLWGFLARFAPDPAIRRLVLVAYALGSMAMTYSILFYSHQLGAVCIASAWILALDAAEGRRRPRAMFAAGVLAGAAPLADYQAVFAAVPVAIHVVAVLWRRASPSEDGRAAHPEGVRRSIASPSEDGRAAHPEGVRRSMTTKPELVRSIGLAVAGAAIPIAVLLGYHAVCFGSPWKTGYDASTTFAHFHQQGFLGITELRWEALWGSLLRIDNGLFALAPWLLLALPGTVVLARRRSERGVALVGAGVLVTYVLFVSSINFWRGGWGVGPRYITAMLPFLLPATCALLEALKRRPLALGVAGGTIVVGVAVYALSSATFPYWPDSLKHPLVEVTFRMLGDGLVAGNVGSALGVGGLAGVVPYLVLVAGLLGVVLVRAATWRGAALAGVIGGIWLVAYAQLPRSAPAHGERVYKVVRAAVGES